MAIAGIFTLVIVSVVYGWGANANCWDANGSQYASATAGCNGKLRVHARVDLNQDDDQARFANEAIAISAYSASDPGDPALAQSDVHGFDANNAFQVANAFDNN